MPPDPVCCLINKLQTKSDFLAEGSVYDEDMKFAPTVLLLAMPLLAAAPELKQVHSVYVLPMTSSLDQYVIDRIVAKGQFTVVTDPLKADAIFTDRVGEALDTKLDDILVSKEDKKKKKEAEKDSLTDNGPTRLTSFSKGRGTVFLVDRQSRNVLWSTYARPKTSTPDELHHIADQIVDRLEKAHKVK